MRADVRRACSTPGSDSRRACGWSRPRRLPRGAPRRPRPRLDGVPRAGLPPPPGEPSARRARARSWPGGRRPVPNSASRAAIRSAAPSSPTSASASAVNPSSSARRRAVRQGRDRLPRRLLAQTDPLVCRAGGGVEQFASPSRSVPREASAVSASSRGRTACSSASVSSAAAPRSRDRLGRSQPSGRRAYVLARERPQRLVESVRAARAVRPPPPGASTAAAACGPRAPRPAHDPDCPASAPASAARAGAACGACRGRPPPRSAAGGRAASQSIASTRPCETTVHLLAEAGVRQQLEHVGQPAAGAVDAVLALPARFSLRTIEISAAGSSTAPEALSRITSTSASGPRPHPVRAGKDHVLHRLAAHRTGDCSPIAHSTASVMFDLPLPFGPTTTDTPGVNSSRVRSGNDLKPFSVIDLRCTSTAQAVERGLGCRLLGVLLRAPCAARQLLALDDRRHLEAPLVRRALLGGHVVGDDRPQRAAAPAAPT